MVPLRVLFLKLHNPSHVFKLLFGFFNNFNFGSCPDNWFSIISMVLNHLLCLIMSVLFHKQKGGPKMKAVLTWTQSATTGPLVVTYQDSDAPSCTHGNHFSCSVVATFKSTRLKAETTFNHFVCFSFYGNYVTCLDSTCRTTSYFFLQQGYYYSHWLQLHTSGWGRWLQDCRGSTNPGRA